MKLNMQFKEYLEFLRDFSNSPLTLNRLTLPFGVISNSDESTTLLVGHVLEDLSQRIQYRQAVDPIDVLVSAYELGHEPAGAFLDEVPYILAKMSSEWGIGEFH